MKPLFSIPETARSKASRPIVWVGLILLSSAAVAQSAPAEWENLDGPTLMRLALAHDEAERHRRAGWVCDQEMVTVKLDAQDHPLDTRRESRAGVALDATQRASGTVSAGGDAMAAREQERDGQFDIAVDLGRLANRFELQREADGFSRDGRTCYVVAFRPRVATPPASDNREERVLSQLAGRFWLAKSDLAIVQSEGALVRAVSVAWVASVNRLRFRYQSLVLPGAGGTLPASFELELGVSAPFYHASQRQTTTMARHRPPSAR